MSESIGPATGTWTTNGLPHGRTSITPHIVVARAADAVAFYRDVLGATVHDITWMGDRIGQADLEFGQGWLTLSDPLEPYGLVAPAPDAAAVSFSLALYVPDVDATVARAAAAGATVREPLTTFVSGDRYASLLDPFGVRWAIMTRVEDLSPEESARRVAAWASAQG
jgi:PhnB protein